MVQQLELTLEEMQKACSAGWNNVIGVVLFGSRARGDQRPGADWDIGIIFSGEEEPEFEVPGDWDLFLWDQDRWEEGFALQVEIAKDGKILLDPEGRIAERFEKIREYILPHWAGYLKRLG